MTFTATDVTDGIVLQQKPSVTFVTPPAAGAGINANPTVVTANGIAATTITVIAERCPQPADAGQARHAVARERALADHRPKPERDRQQRTDSVHRDEPGERGGHLHGGRRHRRRPRGAGERRRDVHERLGRRVRPEHAGPGRAERLYGHAVRSPASRWGRSSSATSTTAAAPGVTVPGFFDGSWYVPNFLNGDLFKVGPEGGVVSNANKLSTLGPTLGWVVVGKDGRLYAARSGTGGNFNTGVVVELDPNTGAVLRTLASDLTLSARPRGRPDQRRSVLHRRTALERARTTPRCSVSGTRATPTRRPSVYATLPFTPNGQIVFSPKGTIYVGVGLHAAEPAGRSGERHEWAEPTDGRPSFPA